ncbi:MAG: tetratricopeptide repeat protein [Alphaproteobacteria bacterium]|jgi:DNA-binding CsgD family transcriptional regulator/tetratricopeptide (TPR) repeat protein|nr:tetratricopeptide repeat protein [Alphaproteobacteria bacterium]MBT5390401.1 tetratricopeptide repeat protein [Alphaproteobacteria bacterium]
MSDETKEISNDLFLKHFETIDGIKFTRRQIDVISCIVSGWNVKSIARILSISPNTVETHIYTISQKLGYGGRDYIVRFIEKSGKDFYIKQHYLKLTRGEEHLETKASMDLSEFSSFTNFVRKFLRVPKLRFFLFSILILGVLYTIFSPLMRGMFFAQSVQISSFWDRFFPSVKRSAQDGSKLTRTNIPTFQIDEFSGRQDELEKISSFLSKTRHVNIFGISGIGKTRLAYAYGVKKLQKGMFVWSFDMQKGLRSQIYNLAKILISEELVSSKNIFISENETWILKKILSTIVNHYDEVYFILDDMIANEHNMELIKTRLATEKVYIITTSKKKIDWESSVFVGPLTKESSKNYLQANLNNYNKHDVIKLVERLKGFPIALKQTVGFLNNTNLITIQDYLKKTDVEYKEEISNETFWTDSFALSEAAEKALYITVKSLREESKSASLLLEFLSELYNKNIPIQYVYYFAKEKGIKNIDAALLTLENYGLIHVIPNRTSTVDKSINIHDFVKDYISSKTISSKRKDHQKIIASYIQSIFKEIPFKKRLSFMINNPTHMHHIEEILASQNGTSPILPPEILFHLKLLLLEHKIFIERNYQKSTKIIKDIKPFVEKYNLNKESIINFYIFESHLYPYNYVEKSELNKQITKLSNVLGTLKTTDKYGDQRLIVNCLIAQVYLYTGDMEKVNKYLIKASKLIDNDTSNRSKLTYYYFKTWYSYDSGKFEDAILFAKKGIKVGEKAGAEGDLHALLFIYDIYSMALCRTGKYKLAREIAEKCLNLCRDYFPNTNNDNYAEALYAAALAEYKLKNYHSAKELVEESISVYNRFNKGYPLSREIAELKIIYGDIFFKLNEPEKAEESYDSSIEIYKKVLSNDSSDYYSAIYYKYFKLFLYMSNYSKAEHYYKLLKEIQPAESPLLKAAKEKWRLANYEINRKLSKTL